MPLSIINWLIPFDLSIEKDIKVLTIIIISCLLFIFDYIYYFRSTKRSEILSMYTGKYEFIDQSTTLAYLLFFMLPLMLSMFICVVLNVDRLPWQ